MNGKALKKMASCSVQDCHREPEDDTAKEPLCFHHRIKTVSFDFSNLGHLRNRMYPGLTNKETTDRIYKEAERVGEPIHPVDRGSWT